MNFKPGKWTHLLSKQDVGRHDRGQHHAFSLSCLSFASAELGDSLELDMRDMLDSDLELTSLGFILSSRSRRSRVLIRNDDKYIDYWSSLCIDGHGDRREKVLAAIESTGFEARSKVGSELLSSHIEDCFSQGEGKFSRSSIRLVSVGLVAKDRSNVDIVVIDEFPFTVKLDLEIVCDD